MKCLKYASAVVMAGLVVMTALPAASQSYIRAPCATGPIPKFEDHLQSLWYRRFWTGDCKDLPTFGCRSGRPYWNDVVQMVIARASSAKRSDVSRRICRLGDRIGFEWTRPKGERRIDTNDLQSLDGVLKNSPDMLTGLESVELRVRDKLGG